MPNWFGSKKTDERRSSAESEDGMEGPDEHTRLLPNRVNGDAPAQARTPAPYLSPDDPAVSPYNLWSVRLVRWVTFLFAILTFLWWVVQLVSTFITTPGMHTRGSGFFAFSYSSITFASLLVLLFTFGAPSKTFRVLCMIVAILTLVQGIIILAVSKIRADEGLVGVTTVVWAFLMSLWILGADRLVQWGKTEEEERLTGRPESRRTLFEWTEVLIENLAMFVVVIVAVLMSCTMILRAVDASLAPPGELYWVDGGKYQIHLYCHGNNTDSHGTRLPTVLFEGGEAPVEFGIWQFADNAVKNGSISRYCFADRPGLAWSDTAPSPLSAGMATDALSQALSKAGEDGPWVLASAGIGSIYNRIFSARHGTDVDGMLMIDPLHEDLLYRVSSSGRGFLLWLRGVMSPIGWDRLPAALFRGRSREDRVWGRCAYENGKYLFAKLQESLVADTLTQRDVGPTRQIQQQDTPLVLISSGQQIKHDTAWEAKQRRLSKLTENLKHWDIIDNAPHEVWKSLEGRQMMEKRLKQLVHKK